MCAQRRATRRRRAAAEPGCRLRRGTTVAHVSPDGTRVSVVRAALPLIGQYDSLTTAQIAHAAGVDEADLLREFEGKDAILHACIAHLQTAMATAVDDHEVLRDIS